MSCWNMSNGLNKYHLGLNWLRVVFEFNGLIRLAKRFDFEFIYLHRVDGSSLFTRT
jgi:hypothetical protein